MEGNATYYQHSGKFRPDGILWMALFGATAALVLGVVYGYIIYYIPFIYLNFLGTLFFGALVGIAVGFGARLGNVRNMKLLTLFGLLAGILAEYVGWVSWFYAMMEQESLTLSLSQMWLHMQVVAALGAWSIFGWTPTGWELYAIWLIEAVMIVGASTLAALGVLSTEPFCETCQKWLSGKHTIDTLEPLEDVDAFRQRLEAATVDAVAALSRSTDASKWSRLELCYCEGCQDSQFLGITTVVVEKDKNNKEKKEENTVVENLRLSADDLGRIRQHFAAG